jgi:hypothetical protein
VHHPPPTKSVILKQLACGLEGENVLGTRRDVTFVCEVSTFVTSSGGRLPSDHNSFLQGNAFEIFFLWTFCGAETNFLQNTTRVLAVILLIPGILVDRKFVFLLQPVREQPLSLNGIRRCACQAIMVLLWKRLSRLFSCGRFVAPRRNFSKNTTCNDTSHSHYSFDGSPFLPSQSKISFPT